MKRLRYTVFLLLMMLSFPLPTMAKDAVIHSGVYIMGVNVGGMTKMEAMTVVDEFFEEASQQTVTLTYADGSTEEVTLSALGFQWDEAKTINQAGMLGNEGGLIKRYKDRMNLAQSNIYIEAPYKLSDDQIQSTLEILGQNHDSPAVNAQFSHQGESFVVTSEAQEGVVTDLDATTLNITDTVAEYMEHGSKVNLKTDIVNRTDYPSVTSKDVAFVKDILGTFSTDYADSSSNRKKNIDTAVSYLNGIILQPGEQLSIDTALHPRTEDYGYAVAAQYSNGESEQAIGGGVCQVSTTIYNALLLAELQIDKRFSHSMVVHYVDYGMDAAIAEGLKDLVFTNNLENPIYIEATADGSDLTFTIWGTEYRPENRRISYLAETLSEELPATDDYNEKYSSDYKKGEIHITGTRRPEVKAKLTKLVYVNDQLESSEVLHIDHYAASKLNRVHGTKEE